MTYSEPRGMAVEDGDAELAPLVSASLQLWDRLGLELGEAVLVTGGHRWTRLAALVATWYGADPVLLLTDDQGDTPAGVTRIDVGGVKDQAGALRARLQGRGGMAAAELSGRADVVDLLLEAMPPSSRLMLAGSGRELLTIDYYVNVHRKGLHLVSGIFGGEDRDGDDLHRLERVHRLLDRHSRAAACRQALAMTAINACERAAASEPRERSGASGPPRASV